MSIESQLNRIRADRNTIRAKLVELGMATNTDNLDQLAEAIDALVNRGAVSALVKEGETYTIPAGYHNGGGTISGVAGGGNYSLQSKTVEPTTKRQTVAPDSGYFALSDVTVLPIPTHFQDVSGVTADPEHVLQGKLYVTPNGGLKAGMMYNRGAATKTLDGQTNEYMIPEGYHNGHGIIGIVLQPKTVTPSKSQQEIMPDSGKVLSQVIVNPIPAAYQDVTGVTTVASHVLDGDYFVDEAGAKVKGTMANNGAVNKSFDGLTTTSVTIPTGYTSGGTVNLTADIENALAAI